MKNIFKVVFAIGLATIALVGCCEDEAGSCCGDSIQGEIEDWTGLDGCGLILVCEEGNLEVMDWGGGLKEFLLLEWNFVFNMKTILAQVFAW